MSAPLHGHPNERVTPEVCNFNNAEMEKNDELTAPNFGKKLQEPFGIDFFESKVRRLRQRLRWVQTGSKYCQLIRETNSTKQLECCLKCVEDKKQFDDVLTDVCSIHMEKHAKLCFRCRLEEPKLKGRASCDMVVTYL